MNIALLTCIHQRHELTKRTIEHNFNMSKQLFDSDVCQMHLFAVMSLEDRDVMADECENAFMFWQAAPNKPVSMKWQAAVKLVRDTMGDDLDAVMLINSDDFVTYEYFVNAADVVQSGQSLGFGPDRCWMLETQTGKMGQWRVPVGEKRSGMIGAGRVLTRELLDRVDWRLWVTEQDQGLDSACCQRLEALGYGLDLLGLDVYDKRAVVDVKTSTNIWAFDSYDYPLVLNADDASAYMEALGLESALEVQYDQITEG